MVRSVCVIIWAGDFSGQKLDSYVDSLVEVAVHTWWPSYHQARYFFLTNHSFLV